MASRLLLPNPNLKAQLNRIKIKISGLLALATSNQSVKQTQLKAQLLNRTYNKLKNQLLSKQII
jgi:hypothetical protein